MFKISIPLALAMYALSPLIHAGTVTGTYGVSTPLNTMTATPHDTKFYKHKKYPVRRILPTPPNNQVKPPEQRLNPKYPTQY